ncbi:MAG: SDR family oxidoreductase [Betaproteobacteria bacterium]|jgi:nucleoside-diphosphate-sugar epimerase
MSRVAVITGATGVVGRYLLAHLAGSPGWDVIAVSRRAPDVPGRFRHLSVDLLDPESCRVRLGELKDVTHVFHAAYLPDPDPRLLARRNTDMLVNAVTAIEASGSPLRHVNLVEGTKWYGSHLGPFTTPAKESHPRHAGANFYFDQQDWLEAAQRGRTWTWSAVRPHAVCGFSLGSPMNLALAIAMYGTMCRELGMPFSHPGTPENYRALYQVTDSGLLARAMAWMATDPGCANEAVNITNGDLFRWENVWPRLATFFGVKTGPQHSFSLREVLGDKGPIWDAMVARHGLRPHAYSSLAGWGFADFVFGSSWDIISDVGKARRAGFAESVDSEEMLLRLLAGFRADRIIP